MSSILLIFWMQCEKNETSTKSLLWMLQLIFNKRNYKIFLWHCHSELLSFVQSKWFLNWLFFQLICWNKCEDKFQWRRSYSLHWTLIGRRGLSNLEMDQTSVSLIYFYTESWATNLIIHLTLLCIFMFSFSEKHNDCVL